MDIASLVAQLAATNEQERRAAGVELYRQGADRAQAAMRPWGADAELRRLVSGPPTVGIAVHASHFQAIREAWGSPRLADVPAEQDAREFELAFEFDGAPTRLDILTTREPSDPASQGDQGAIARFLQKQGEGIQQVEFPCKDVTRAAAILRERFGLQPAYTETRPGADGTRVNFFLAATPDGQKVLIELFEK